MLYYCKGNDVVIAMHEDDQQVDPSVYGFGTYVVVAPRIAAPPPWMKQAPEHAVPPGSMEASAQTDTPVSATSRKFPELTREVITNSIKWDARRRILQHVPEHIQRNISMYLATINASALRGGQLNMQQHGEIDAGVAILRWIGRPDGIQAASDKMVQSGDREWRDDGKWPAWNPDWDQLIARL